MKVKTSKVDFDQDDLTQLEKMIDGIESGSLFLGPPNITQEKMLECVKGMFDPDKDTTFKFIYTQIVPIEKGFLLQWGAKSYGFGEFILEVKDGEVVTDLKDENDKEVFMMAMARVIGWKDL